jgi:hypothetical protein
MHRGTFAIEIDDGRGPLHVSQQEFDEWVDRELRRDPYGRVSAEVVLYGAPRLFKGRAYVIVRPKPA